MNVNTLPIQARTGSTKLHVSALYKLKSVILSMLVKNISLLKKPLNGGRPAIENAPISVIVNVIGMIVIRPPSLRISLVPVS